MKPLILKEPAACCRAALLVWVPGKGHYTCPCGETKTDMNGRLLRKKGGLQLSYGKKKGTP